MNELDTFLRTETRGGSVVAVMEKNCSFGSGTFVLNLRSARLRLENLQAGGWAHDQTARAVRAIELAASEGEAHE